MAERTYCRLCEGTCGHIAHAAAGRLSALEGDPEDPVSGGFLCETARASLGALAHPERLTRPLRRVDGQLVPTTWDEAIREIGAHLLQIRSKSGPSSVGLHLGGDTLRSTRDLVRGLAFGVGMGTPAIFTDLCQETAPQLRVTELMMGHPAPLLPDVGRAHYALLLGGDQRRTNWGPLQAGMLHERELAHSRKTKGTKVIVADPRRTDLARDMDQHLPIRPGTEPFLLLGMLAATVQGGWHDHQYCRDYTRNLDALADALAPWGPERCAAICGLPPATISGVALKFSRAAMAVAHPGHAAFANANGAAGAWAWLALHVVTANALRPGGLYESRGAVDLQPLLAAIPTADAPRARASGVPLLLMQAPTSLLAEEILAPGEGAVRALISAGADPVTRLPDPSRTKQALAALDLFVYLGRVPGPAMEHAHWVLPLAHPWEREDVSLLDSQVLPLDAVLWTPPLHDGGDARTVDAVLRDLFAATRPGLRGSAWGRHLGVLAQLLARADLAPWEKRALDWGIDLDPDALRQERRFVRGPSDRSTWRPSTPDGRLDLLPDLLRDAVARLDPPSAEAPFPLYLRTGGRADRAPDPHHRPAADPAVLVHPDLGLAEGATARVVTRFGQVRLPVRHDAALRPDTVDVPAQLVPDALALLDGSWRDPLLGTPAMDGLACRIERA